MKRKRFSPGIDTSPPSNSKEQNSGYIADSKLVSRVEQYLAAIKAAGPVNMDLMADDLQSKYTEYSRKKRNPFRKAVRRAYIVVSSRSDENEDENLSALELEHLEKRKKCGKDDDESSSESMMSDEGHSISSDNMNYVDYQDTNAMNSCMTDLYASGGRLVHGGGGPASHGVAPARSMAAAMSSAASIASAVASLCQPGLLSGLPPLTPSSAIQHAHRLVAAPRNVPIVIDSDAGGSDTGGAARSAVAERGERKRRIKNPTPESPGEEMTERERRDDERTGRRGDERRDEEMRERRGEERRERRETVTERARSVEEVAERVQEAGEKRSSVTMSRRMKRRENEERLKRDTKKREEEGKKTKKGKWVETDRPTVTFSDIGGCDSTLVEVCKLLVHMKHPEIYRRLGVSPPRGFLLHGPPGCGKTLLAHAIAGELQLPFIKLAATEIVSGVSGESEEKLRDIFNDAMASAPCILFLDEIDAITPKREVASKDMERRIVSQLLSCMDELNRNDSSQHVLVIGATNRPDAIDPALRRAGRFDREISVGIPDEKARVRILEVLCRDLRLSSDFDFAQLAKLCPGYVGADLMSLAREAAITAVNRVFNEVQTTKPLADSESGDAATSATASMEVEVVASTSAVDDETAKADTSLSGDEHVNGEKECDAAKRAETKSGSADDEKGKSGAGVSGEDTTEGESKSTPEEDTTDVKSSSVSEEEKMTGKSDSVPEGESSSSSGSSINSSNLTSVISWLRDKPPLTDDQLASLSISLDDFQVALRKVQPSAKREGFVTVPDVTWDDIGALADVRSELQMAILAPVKHPEHFQALGLTTPAGVLLAGPPGCGKTLLAKAVANESGINFISVKGPELLNMYVGESERAVRQVFQRARDSAPCVIFFDELDALCPRRTDSSHGGSSVRVVNQLLTEMDGLEDRKQVFIMGATNRPDIIDPAVLRPGRLDKILYVGLPSPDDRVDILNTITKKGTKPNLAGDVALSEIARKCDGFTGADLAALVREAAVTSLREFLERGEVQPLVVNNTHFSKALQKVKPSVSAADQLAYVDIRRRN